MNAIIFDKTGTLTEGRPAVSDMHNFSSAPLAEVLHLAVAAEVHSEHPLGQAMVHYAAEALGMGLSGGVDICFVCHAKVSCMHLICGILLSSSIHAAAVIIVTMSRYFIQVAPPAYFMASRP